MELAGIDQSELSWPSPQQFDGCSLLPLVDDTQTSQASEFYISECTWMRKHGWRTPGWKLMVALEPDFHFKPPKSSSTTWSRILWKRTTTWRNRSRKSLADLRRRMEAWVVQREAETGLTNPMLTQGDWHGKEGVGALKPPRSRPTIHSSSATLRKVGVCRKRRARPQHRRNNYRDSRGKRKA